METHKEQVTDLQGESKKETHLGLHTYSNGAMSDCFIFEEFNLIDKTNNTPLRKAHNRLIIGTDKNKTYLRFQLVRFEQRLQPEPSKWEYVGDAEMDRYSGFSCSPQMAVQIKNTITKMGF